MLVNLLVLFALRMHHMVLSKVVPMKAAVTK